MEPVRIRTQLLTFKIFSNVQSFNNCAGVVSLSHITSFDELKDCIRELRPTVTAADLQAARLKDSTGNTVAFNDLRSRILASKYLEAHCTVDIIRPDVLVPYEDRDLFSLGREQAEDESEQNGHNQDMAGGSEAYETQQYDEEPGSVAIDDDTEDSTGVEHGEADEREELKECGSANDGKAGARADQTEESEKMEEKEEKEEEKEKGEDAEDEGHTTETGGRDKGSRMEGEREQDDGEDKLEDGAEKELEGQGKEKHAQPKLSPQMESDDLSSSGGGAASPQASATNRLQADTPQPAMPSRARTDSTSEPTRCVFQFDVVSSNVQSSANSRSRLDRVKIACSIEQKRTTPPLAGPLVSSGIPLDSCFIYEPFTRHLVSSCGGRPHMVFRPEAGYADKLREVLTLPDADFNHGKNQNGDTLADHMMCIGLADRTAFFGNGADKQTLFLVPCKASDHTGQDREGHSDEEHKRNRSHGQTERSVQQRKARRARKEQIVEDDETTQEEEEADDDEEEEDGRAGQRPHADDLYLAGYMVSAKMFDDFQHNLYVQAVPDKLHLIIDIDDTLLIPERLSNSSFSSSASSSSSSSFSPSSSSSSSSSSGTPTTYDHINGSFTFTVPSAGLTIRATPRADLAKILYDLSRYFVIHLYSAGTRDYAVEVVKQLRQYLRRTGSTRRQLKGVDWDDMLPDDRVFSTQPLYRLTNDSLRRKRVENVLPFYRFSLLRHSVLVIDDSIEAWVPDQQHLVLCVDKQSRDPGGQDLARVARCAQDIFDAFRRRIGEMGINERADFTKKALLQQLQDAAPSGWLDMVTKFNEKRNQEVLASVSVLPDTSTNPIPTLTPTDVHSETDSALANGSPPSANRSGASARQYNGSNSAGKHDHDMERGREKEKVYESERGREARKPKERGREEARQTERTHADEEVHERRNGRGREDERTHKRGREKQTEKERGREKEADKERGREKERDNQRERSGRKEKKRERRRSREKSRERHHGGERRSSGGHVHSASPHRDHTKKRRLSYSD